MALILTRARQHHQVSVHQMSQYYQINCEIHILGHTFTTNIEQQQQKTNKHCSSDKSLLLLCMLAGQPGCVLIWLVLAGWLDCYSRLANYDYTSYD